VPPRAPWLMLN